VSPFAVPLLALSSFVAGFVDAVAGGGGLVTLPALLAAGIPPHAALATNKGQATFGAVSSAASFWSRGAVDRGRAPIGFAFGVLGSLCGAALVLAVPPGPLKPLVLVLLAAAAFVVMWPRKAPPPGAEPRSPWATLPIALAMGFYDGFFGPGTGSLLIVAFVVVYREALLSASANAKIVNLASNLAALAIFSLKGAVLWKVALPMAASNIVGAATGARVAMKRGDRFVRIVVVLVVAALMTKVVWDLAHA
jgi:uncharacterized membrane protein YfcA